MLIDFHSDTVTKPTLAMRRCMAEAEVGDEQLAEDPTVNRLQERIAKLLGKEAALYLPSGTMCNAIAMRVHCRPGDEMLAHRTAHPINYEAGSPAGLAGINVQALDGPRGQYDADTLAANLRPKSRYAPRSRLAWIEQTSNMGGGSIWPLEHVRAVSEVARNNGLAVHLDGARLMNAVVGSGVAAHEWGALVDTIWLDFSKGLGAPVGAAIAGSREFITEAWRHKQQMGGSMRQAGIIAAGALYGLDHHVDRLAEDHENARTLANALSELPWVTLDPTTVETNVVIFDVSASGLAASEIVQKIRAADIRVSAISPTLIRAVTHLDISREDIARTIEVFRGIL